MILTPEVLSALVDDARAALAANTAELEDAHARIRELEEKARELADELRVFQSILVRRDPARANAVAQDPAPGLDDWRALPRTIAVERAIKALEERDGVATPASIEQLLHEHGRDDRRDPIGGALAHLNRNEKIVNVGRGRWKLAAPAIGLVTEEME